MEQKIERMPRHTLFALSLVLVHMEWQSGDGLCQDADAGVNRRGLHGSALVDHLLAGRFAEHERPAAEVVTVGGLVP